MKHYKTEKRKILFDFLIRNNKIPLSAEEIYEKLGVLSISAIYRNLSSFTSEGVVRRSLSSDGHTVLYQYIDKEHCHTHLHMKCNMCGKVLCMDEGASKRLVSAMENNGFEIDANSTFIFGVCSSCH